MICYHWESRLEQWNKTVLEIKNSYLNKTARTCLYSLSRGLGPHVSYPERQKEKLSQDILTQTHRYRHSHTDRGRQGCRPADASQDMMSSGVKGRKRWMLSFLSLLLTSTHLSVLFHLSFIYILLHFLNSSITLNCSLTPEFSSTNTALVDLYYNS